MSINIDENQLTHEEADTIGEILNISMGAAATAISVMLNKQVNITTPVVKNIKNDDFQYKELEPAIGVEINYIHGLHGSNLMIMSISDVKAIVSSLLGEESTVGNDLDEMHTSALGEVMNQMMGSASTALASFFDKGVDISPPNVVNPREFYEKFFAAQENDSVVTVSFKFVVDDLLDSQFITVLPMDFVRELISNAMNFDKSTAVEPKSNYDDTVTGHTQIRRPVFANEPAAPVKEKSKPQPQRSENTSSQGQKPKKNVSVQNIQFDMFDEEDTDNDTPDQMNLDLVMGVEVVVTVEIGHTKKLVKDVLNISKGSIIELDKQAGEPVDVIVNGQLIAKGDVVVIDDNFGVRITKVLNGKN